MAEPIEVVWKTKGMKNVLSELKTVSKAFDNAQKKADQAGTGSSRGRGTGGVVRAQTAPKVPALPAYAKAALTQRQKLTQLLQQAQQGGNAGAASAIQARIDRLNRPGTMGQKVQSLVSAARIGSTSGSGGGLGAISKLTGLAADAEAAGPLGILAAAAITAATAVGKMAEAAASSANRFSNLQFATGSQGTTAGKLKALGASVGMDESAVGAMAENFHKRITEDPIGRSYAQTMGINPGGAGTFGNQNYGAELLQGIKALRGIKDFTERERVARATGLEGALPFTNLSDRQFDKMDKDGALQSKIYDPESQTRAADYTASIGRLTSATDALESAIGKALIPGITNAANRLADLSYAAATFANDHPGLVKIGESVVSPEAGFVDMLFGGHENKHIKAGAASAADAQQAALDENTKALKANTAAVGAPGTYGNGPRMRGAIPEGIGGDFLRHALEATGYKLGNTF